MYVVRGRVTPAARQAAWVRPEQSYAEGPVAPHTYGLPSWARAKEIASAARAFGAVTGPRTPPEERPARTVAVPPPVPVALGSSAPVEAPEPFRAAAAASYRARSSSVSRARSVLASASLPTTAAFCRRSSASWARSAVSFPADSPRSRRIAASSRRTAVTATACRSPAFSASAARSRYWSGSEVRASCTAGSSPPVRYWAAAMAPSPSRAVLSRSVLRAASSRSRSRAVRASSAFSFAPLYRSVATSASS